MSNEIIKALESDLKAARKAGNEKLCEQIEKKIYSIKITNDIKK